MSGGVLTVTVLGCGASIGVPVVGCKCRVCQERKPKNIRTRPSVWITSDRGTSILIDASSDFREQALEHGIEGLDAILFTHAHADHIMGLDDVRPVNKLNRESNRAESIPLYGTPLTLSGVRHRFDYLFSENHDTPWVAKVNPVEIDDEASFQIKELTIRPFRMQHGRVTTTGFRIGGFSYATDCDSIPDNSLRVISNSQLLIIDALRVAPSPSHFTVEEACRVGLAAGAERILLTHLNHENDYDELLAILPPKCEPAYDGLLATVDV